MGCGVGCKHPALHAGQAAPANQTSIVWVLDPAWIPADTMDDTRRARIEFCATARQVPGLGQFVAIDKFAIK
jgi:hypothetical protein